MTLTLQLDREDLEALVRGFTPSYAVMSHPLVKAHYEYGDHPQRQWWRDLSKLNEAELWTLYLVIKKGRT
jgi:hypothetical protein